MPITSFYAALSGLDNNATAINIVGNNLANMNTTAFKSSRTSFSEVLGGLASTGTSGNPIQSGLGSSISAISPVFTQGSINSTGRSTDAAISGNGFFVVSTGEGLGFTRAGSFGFDKSGAFLSSDGFNVMGYGAVNGKIDSTATLSPIVIRKGQATPPQATQNITLSANLDAQAVDGATFATPLRIYDSLGQSHDLSVTFTKSGAGQWDWSATLPAADTGGTGDPVEVGAGALSFDEVGALTTLDPGELTISGFASGAADQTVAFKLVDSNDKPLITSYAATSSVSATEQDGASASTLRDISINAAGVISGIFDNGQTQPLAQLAIADFPNIEGLMKLKGSTFAAYGSSGEASIGVAGTGGRGTVSGAALEQSNVDIAHEFTNLIIAQRGYQASSRIIATTDELYQDAINLKR